MTWFWFSRLTGSQWAAIPGICESRLVDECGLGPLGVLERSLARCHAGGVGAAASSALGSLMALLLGLLMGAIVPFRYLEEGGPGAV